MKVDSNWLTTVLCEPSFDFVFIIVSNDSRSTMYLSLFIGNQIIGFRKKEEIKNPTKATTTVKMLVYLRNAERRRLNAMFILSHFFLLKNTANNKMLPLGRVIYARIICEIRNLELVIFFKWLNIDTLDPDLIHKFVLNM